MFETLIFPSALGTNGIKKLSPKKRHIKYFNIFRFLTWFIEVSHHTTIVQDLVILCLLEVSDVVEIQV
jgi:hypothetical protein